MQPGSQQQEQHDLEEGTAEPEFEQAEAGTSRQTEGEQLFRSSFAQLCLSKTSRLLEEGGQGLELLLATVQLMCMSYRCKHECVSR